MEMEICKFSEAGEKLENIYNGLTSVFVEVKKLDSEIKLDVYDKDSVENLVDITLETGKIACYMGHCKCVRDKKIELIKAEIKDTELHKGNIDEIIDIMRKFNVREDKIDKIVAQSKELEDKSNELKSKLQKIEIDDPIVLDDSIIGVRKEQF